VEEGGEAASGADEVVDEEGRALLNFTSRSRLTASTGAPSSSVARYVVP
jgi:hypothetical protein